mmetsp:Transcript_115201/g.372322  ORF Transcript_115201/g.372322 Transcript_115201/m.372322 type:complete len:217 (-) Transcript_115201:364-1014(-)
MKPMDLPKTKRPLRQPKAIKSSTSSSEKAPQDLSMSTKQTAMQPSTLRMRLALFLVVTCSTARAKSRMLVSLKCFFANSLMITTRWSGFARDLILWPIPMISLFIFLDCSTKSFGPTPLSWASLNIFAASSKAPPKRGPTVRRPEAKAETRSLPARAVTMALCAPLTAGPWSAVTMRTISMNLQQASGNRRRNHRSESTPPTPKDCEKTSEMDIPQ